MHLVDQKKIYYVKYFEITDYVFLYVSWKCGYNVCPSKVYYEAQVVHQPAVDEIFLTIKFVKLTDFGAASKIEFLHIS